MRKFLYYTSLVLIPIYILLGNSTLLLLSIYITIKEIVIRYLEKREFKFNIIKNYTLFIDTILLWSILYLIYSQIEHFLLSDAISYFLLAFFSITIISLVLQNINEIYIIFRDNLIISLNLLGIIFNRILRIIILVGFIYAIIDRYIPDSFMYNIESVNNFDRYFNYMYFSSVTFFTVGYGDIVPTGYLSKIITILEMALSYILLGIGIQRFIYKK